MKSYSTRKARSTFRVQKLPSSSYRLTCLVEGCKKPDLGVWDWRGNALNKGYAHAHQAHGISCERGAQVSLLGLFRDGKREKRAPMFGGRDEDGM